VPVLQLILTALLVVEDAIVYARTTIKQFALYTIKQTPFNTPINKTLLKTLNAKSMIFLLIN
jgi:hypothetical protein